MSFLVSARRLKWVGLLAALVLLASGALLVDYVSLVLTSQQNEHLRAQNAYLKQRLHRVQNKMQSFEKAIERLQSLNTKIKRIMNIQNNEDRVLKLALKDQKLLKMGEASTNEVEVERPPASLLLNRETPQQKPPLQEGELGFVGSSLGASLMVRLDGSIQKAGLIEQDAHQLHSLLTTQKSLIGATPSIKPVNGWYSSYFGYRIHPIHRRSSMHNGLDIAAMPGAPVRAPADGLVTYVGYDPGYGKIVTIDHGYGIRTRYGHNSQIYVRMFQKVRRHERIASVGSTGLSTSAHLHYEVHVHGVPVDPRNYILDDEGEEI